MTLDPRYYETTEFGPVLLAPEPPPPPDLSAQEQLQEQVLQSVVGDFQRASQREWDDYLTGSLMTQGYVQTPQGLQAPRDLTQADIDEGVRRVFQSYLQEPSPVRQAAEAYVGRQEINYQQSLQDLQREQALEQQIFEGFLATYQGQPSRPKKPTAGDMALQGIIAAGTTGYEPGALMYSDVATGLMQPIAPLEEVRKKAEELGRKSPVVPGLISFLLGALVPVTPLEVGLEIIPTTGITGGLARVGIKKALGEAAQDLVLAGRKAFIQEVKVAGQASGWKIVDQAGHVAQMIDTEGRRLVDSLGRPAVVFSSEDLARQSLVNMTRHNVFPVAGRGAPSVTVPAVAKVIGAGAARFEELAAGRVPGMAGIEEPLTRTLAQLRAELKAKGLPITGTKAQLEARLAQAAPVTAGREIVDKLSDVKTGKPFTMRLYRGETSNLRTESRGIFMTPDQGTASRYAADVASKPLTPAEQVMLTNLSAKDSAQMLAGRGGLLGTEGDLLFELKIRSLPPTAPKPGARVSFGDESFSNPIVFGSKKDVGPFLGRTDSEQALWRRSVGELELDEAIAWKARSLGHDAVVYTTGEEGAGAVVDLRISLEREAVTPPRVPPIAGVPSAPIVPPKSAIKELFHYDPVESVPFLSEADRVANVIRKTLQLGVLEEPIATAVMRDVERGVVRGDSQSNRLAAVGQRIMATFDLDGLRIKNLAGRPTISHVGAKLPTYIDRLTPAQRDTLELLRKELEVWRRTYDEAGIPLETRGDIIEGGFYIPRDVAKLGDEDVVRPSGLGIRGAKGGPEREAPFPTQMAAIEAGYKYPALDTALKDYGNYTVGRVLYQRAAQYLRDAVDAAGEKIAKSAPDMIDPEVLVRIQDLRGRISALTIQAVRATTRGQAENVAQRKLQKLLVGVERRGVAAEEKARRKFFDYGQTDAAFIRADEEFVTLDMVAGRIAGVAQQANEMFLKTGLRRSDLIRELKDLRSEYKVLQARWKDVQEQARQLPQGRGRISKIAGLSTYSFPEAVANAAMKHLETGKVGEHLATANALQQLLRGLRATGDASFIGIQGLLGSVMSPRSYGKAVVVAIAGMNRKETLASFIRNFDQVAVIKGLPTSREWLAAGLRMGGPETEFMIGGERLGIISKAAGAFLPFRLANRAFGYFGDTLRLGLAQNFYAREMFRNPDITKLANTANLLTGWSERTFGGDIGPWLQFAPRFFESQIELMSKAMYDWGGVEGKLARDAFSRLLLLGVPITAATNEALGNTVGNKDFDWWSPFLDNGQMNPNFMRIRVGGTDLSLFGPWDSMLKAIVSAIKGDFEYITRSKASPIVALAWDFITGKTFMGEDVTLENFWRSFVPFSLSDIGQEPIETTLLASLGLKASPLTQAERREAFRQEKAQERFKTRYEDLTDEQRDVVDKLLQTKDLQSQLSIDIQEAQLPFVQEAVRIQVKVLEGQMGYGEARQQLDNLIERSSEAAQKVVEAAGPLPELKPRSDMEQARAEYFAMIKGLVDPVTGALNYRRYKEELASWEGKWPGISKRDVSFNPMTPFHRELLEDRETLLPFWENEQKVFEDAKRRNPKLFGDARDFGEWFEQNITRLVSTGKTRPQAEEIVQGVMEKAEIAPGLTVEKVRQVGRASYLKEHREQFKLLMKWEYFGWSAANPPNYIIRE